MQSDKTLKRLILAVVAVVLSSWPAIAIGPQKAATPPSGVGQSGFADQVAPLLKKYCVTCHGGPKPKADLALDAYQDDASAAKDRHVWDNVARMLRDGEMPPDGRKNKRPSKAEIDTILGWIEAEQKKAAGSIKRDPGRVTLRRLNRAEYNNTIRDLLGVRFQPAADFPSDDIGYGFDNIGDVLSLPPMLMEKYLAAAEKVVASAFDDPQARKRIMIDEPGEKNKRDVARKILDQFASRAYRRPATKEELDRLARLVELAEKNGESFEKAVQLALKATLVSPHFLFKVERDRESSDADGVQPINDYELATRLSYFLWSSMPDEELFAQAQKGTLRNADVLEVQVKRMLRDVKAQALVENFAGQWLLTRNLKTMTPDPGQFPSFDEPLRQAMIRETELLFEAIMKENRGILDFVDADFTFVNERLARHYGIDGVRGDEFRRVSLAGTSRGGVLTHASVLTVTSNPTRTSPVKRGKYILENILGTPPPPPVPEVGELSEDKAVTESASLRKRMEEHRRNPSCATCHQRMDPLGFALENFDGIGAWRTKDGKFDIDASGSLPNGESFSGPDGLRTVLRKKEAAFRQCFVEKMLTYALGRGMEYYDKRTVDGICQATAKDGDRFSVVVLEIVKSDPFQFRRAARATKREDQKK